VYGGVQPLRVDRKNYMHPAMVRHRWGLDGLVAEAWFFGDELRLLRQLGVVPDPLVRTAATLGPPVPGTDGERRKGVT
jgi:hypothetical protein